MEVTNRTIAMLLSVSIFIILIGLGVGLKPGITGAALTNISDLGEVNLTIAQQTVIVFVDNSVDFGTGSVNVSEDYCRMDTQGRLAVSQCVDFNNVTQGLSFRNDGNTNLSVQLNISKGADDFLGGTNPEFQFKITADGDRLDPVQQLDDTAGASPASCNSEWTNTSYTEVTGNLEFYICGNATYYPLSPQNLKDDGIIDFNVTLPNNAPIALKNAIITVTGTSAE